MSSDILISTQTLPDNLKAIVFGPAAWTRLEPQSVSGDPTPGLEARVHDPLWMLARQWQFGEFRGDDAGTPFAVESTTQSRRVTAWQPGNLDNAAPAFPLPEHEPIDPVVEREPSAADGPGLRQRAEAGSLLLTALGEAGFDAKSALLAACPLDASAADVPRVFRTIAVSNPDGHTAAAQLEAGDPAWLGGASPDAVAAASVWLAWYRQNVAPAVAEELDSWIDERIEYHFSVRVGDADTQQVLSAPLHEGGAIDWYSFDHAPNGNLSLAEEPTDGSSTTATRNVLASPLRYAGMPSDRLWQFEDGAVNFGKLEVQQHDLARLCFVEFAMIYGNDWFVLPLDLDGGSFTTVTELAYTTTFGERFVVPPANDDGRTGRFRLFRLDQIGDQQTMNGLFIPPSTRSTAEGRALEDVLIVRDESANMAWAIESIVQDAGGDPRNRRDEPQTAIDPVNPAAPADLQYRLATSVPAQWIPLVPIPTADRNGGFVLRKGTMSDVDESVGRLLDPTPFTLKDEEVPREGVRVRRVPAMLRTTDGRRVRWIARRVSVGLGEGSSGLAFDGATR
ncbi:MAG: hypothetical protein ABJF01_04060 [bacterium]